MRTEVYIVITNILPARIQFVALKSPCQNIKTTFTETDVVIEWAPGSNGIVEDIEIEEFISETINLVFTLVENVIDNNEKWQHTDEALKYLKYYYSKWGPLDDVSKKTQIKLSEIIDLAHRYKNIVSAIYIWNQQSAINEFFKYISDYKKLEKKIVPESLHKIKYWYLHNVRIINDKPYFDFIAVDRKIENLTGLYIKDPTKKDIDRFEVDYNNKISFVRTQVLQYISDHLKRSIKQNKISVEPEFKVSTGFSFNLKICSKLLTFIMLSMDDILSTNIEYCKCGCNNIVPRGRSHFASDKCYEKYKKRDVPRKLKSWLRTRKSRGQISINRYENLCERIDDMYDELRNSGKNDIEIESVIRSEISAILE